MKGPKYILSRLKENFDVTEEEEQQGFPDMNYIIGNSSALDIGQVPTKLGERIGQTSQIGGSMIEVKVANPATFTIERDEIISTVSQLGIDINLHSDMNVGYTSAYKSQGQAYGYNTTQSYFTRYLQELAHFKKEVEEKGEGNQPLFDIGRINPHISTSPMPPLSERMAQDVGVDPFGFDLTEWEIERGEKNIYSNEEFLKKFYHTFILNEVDDPYQIYRLFERFSPKFRKEWRLAQKESCDTYWNSIDQIIGPDDDPILEKIALLQSARMADQGLETEWLKIVNEEVELDEPIENPLGNGDKWTELGDVPGFGNIRQLSNTYYNFPQDGLDLDEDEQKVILDALEKALEKLWKGNGDPFRITIDAKINSLTSHLDIQQTQIWERAQESENLERAAEEMMAGGEEYFEEESDVDKKPEEKHDDLLEALLNNFERAIWMESNIFYRIMPSWMDSATYSGENHRGFRAPKFIWETIVKDKWEKKGFELDLKNPWRTDYFDLLENNEEFQQDVSAAVGACYCWGHFTQRKSIFNLKGRDFGLSAEETSRVQDQGWTWIEWMNRYGIGVNLETMAGSPQQFFKVWRPKDISIAAHAVNLTARNKLEEEGELGGLDRINPELDGCPVKFTIDMEHVASLGASPWPEMEDFIQKEKELAETDYDLEINPDRPIAKILRQYHLMDPGVESEQGTHHGAFDRGNKLLYNWLYNLVEAGFTRNPNETASVMFELAEHKGESSYMMRITMNMIELGIKPEEVTPDNVDPGKDEYRDEREALIARFFGMDKANYSREWAKIEEHAFDPLEGLLEAEKFDYTYSGKASLEADNNPQDYAGEEYR